MPLAVAGLIFFYLVLSATLTRRKVQSYEKISFFSVFSHLGSFPQVFRQVKEWHILELHEMIRCSDVLNCFYFVWWLRWPGGMFKVIKNDNFLVFLHVLVNFLSFWAGEGVAYIYDNSTTCSCVPREFEFALRSRSADRSAQNVAVLNFYSILGLFPYIYGRLALYLC